MNKANKLLELLQIDKEDIESAIAQFYSAVSDEDWPDFADRFEDEVKKAELKSVSPEEAKKFSTLHKLTFKTDPYKGGLKKFKNPEPGDLEASLVFKFKNKYYVLDGQHRLNRAIETGKPADIAIIEGDWIEKFKVSPEWFSKRGYK
jgi:hypothetical protein